MLPDFFSRALNYLYPAFCPSCGRASDSMFIAPFCAYCWGSIKRYSGPACSICASPFSSPDAGVCSECLKSPPAFDRAFCFGLYEGVLSTAIHAYKFQGIKRLHRPLAKLLLTLEVLECDAIIPVPLSPRGLRNRGFNQSLLLAKEVSDEWKTPVFMDILIKKRETPPQIGLSAKERIRNLERAFHATGQVRGMKCLLVDDVMTTGATVRACSRELVDAGASGVSVLTLARASAL